MNRDEVPWPNLTDDELRVLVANGFTAHEIATVAGVDDRVGAWLRNCLLVGDGLFPTPMAA